MRLPLAFLRKDYRAAQAYRFSILLNLVSILFGVVTFRFMGELFRSPGYAAQVLIGIAMANLLVTSLTAVTMKIRREQDLGTLEAVLLAPLPDWFLLHGLILWDFVLAAATGLGYLICSVLLIDLRVTPAVFVRTAGIFVISGLMFFSLAGVAAAFALRFKRWTTIPWAVSSVMVLIGGIYFPVTLLPSPLPQISRYLPLTASVDGLRASLLLTAPFPWEETVICATYSVVCAVCSIFLMRYVLRRARREGSLAHQ